MHHELMIFGSVNDMILVYSLMFHLVFTMILPCGEIRGPTAKVLSGGNMYCVTQSVGIDGLPTLELATQKCDLRIQTNTFKMSVT